MRSGERRQHDRRAEPRGWKQDRRKGDRRRGAAAGLVLTGLALAGALHHGRDGRGSPPSDPSKVTATDGADAQTAPSDAVAAPEAPAPAVGPFDAIIKEAADKYRVDADLVRAVIRTESNFNPLAKSRAGAKGLMQLMPRLARQLGIANPFDARANVFGGVKYLSQLLERHNGNVGLALASFNAGPRNVARYGGIPPFKETRGYVAKITNLLADGGADTARGASD